jgi:hypothetical protein
MADISGDLNALKYAVEKGIGSPAELKAWAAEILGANPRENVPDWVEAVANGNPECWGSVLEVAREMMDEEKPGGLLGPQKGQSLTEAALGLGGIAALLLILWILIGPTVSEGFAMAVGSLDLSNGHAAERHGATTVEAINKCLENKGSTLNLINRDTGRKAEICRMDDGRFAVRILEKNTEGGWRMVTAFVKEKLKTLSDVVRYLGNKGYDPIQ